MFNRIHNVKIFEPENPEIDIIASMTAELFEAVSPKLLIWIFDKEYNNKNIDDIDKLYGEKSSINKNTGLTKAKFDGPFEFFARFESLDILKILSRGMDEQKEEIELYVNIADFTERLHGLVPSSGDIIRISYIDAKNQETGRRSFRHVFYEISTVTPVDLYNYHYLNFHIYCSQTNLNNLPESIVKYDELNAPSIYELNQTNTVPWVEKDSGINDEETMKNPEDFNY